MKYLKKNIVRIITGNAEKVQDETNQLVDELTAKGIEPSVRIEVNPLTSIIQYQIEITKAENAEDRCDKQGVRCHCGDCKYFSKKDDKRVKWGICTKNWAGEGLPPKTKFESHACLSFYEDLEKENNYIFRAQ